MSRLELGMVLREVAAIIGDASAGPAEVMSVAIYLEDALGIRLSDDDLGVGSLGTVTAVSRTIDRYLGAS